MPHLPYKTFKMNKIAEKEMAKLKKDAEYVGNEIKKGSEFIGHEIKENTELAEHGTRIHVAKKNAESPLSLHASFYGNGAP